MARAYNKKAAVRAVGIDSGTVVHTATTPVTIPVSSAVTTPVEAVVAAFESDGDVAVADKLRSVAGLPPRRLTRVEEFVREVQRQVYGGPVCFHAATPEEATEWIAVIREIPYAGKKPLKYDARKTTPTRIEVFLVGKGG